MEVEILLNRTRYVKGKIIDVSEDLARQLIDSEIAKLAKGKKKKPTTEGKNDVKPRADTSE